MLVECTRWRLFNEQIFQGSPLSVIFYKNFDFVIELVLAVS